MSACRFEKEGDLIVEEAGLGVEDMRVKGEIQDEGSDGEMAEVNELQNQLRFVLGMAAMKGAESKDINLPLIDEESKLIEGIRTILNDSDPDESAVYLLFTFLSQLEEGDRAIYEEFAAAHLRNKSHEWRKHLTFSGNLFPVGFETLSPALANLVSLELAIPDYEWLAYELEQAMVVRSGDDFEVKDNGLLEISPEGFRALLQSLLWKYQVCLRPDLIVEAQEVFYKDLLLSADGNIIFPSVPSLQELEEMVDEFAEIIGKKICGLVHQADSDLEINTLEIRGFDAEDHREWIVPRERLQEIEYMTGDKVLTNAELRIKPRRLIAPTDVAEMVCLRSDDRLEELVCVGGAVGNRSTLVNLVHSVSRMITFVNTHVGLWTGSKTFKYPDYGELESYLGRIHYLGGEADTYANNFWQEAADDAEYGPKLGGNLCILAEQEFGGFVDDTFEVNGFLLELSSGRRAVMSRCAYYDDEDSERFQFWGMLDPGEEVEIKWKAIDEYREPLSAVWSGGELDGMSLDEMLLLKYAWDENVHF